MKDQTALNGEILTAQELHTIASERLTELRFSEQEYRSMKTSHDTSQRLVEVARLQRMKCQGELEKKLAMVSRSEEEIQRHDDKRAQLDGLRSEVRTLDECDKILTDFRRHVNSIIRPRLAELACEYLTDLTDGRYTTVELMDDFTPSVLEDGEAKAIMSGGEEDILNVCMRLSLSHMLAERAGQQFSLLLLDEIFGSLDEGRRGNVLGLLEKLRKRFEQILIITHLDDVKDGVQHIIQVEYDDSTGCSAVTSQEGLSEYDSLVGNL